MIDRFEEEISGTSQQPSSAGPRMIIGSSTYNAVQRKLKEPPARCEAPQFNALRKFRII